MLTIQKRFSALQTATMSIGVLGIGFVGSLATLNIYHPGKNTNSSTNPTLSSIAPSSKTTAIPLDSTGSTGAASNSNTGTANSQASQPRSTWPQSTYQSRPTQTVQPASNPVPSAAAPVTTPTTPAPIAAPTPSSGVAQPVPALAAPAPQPAGTGLPLTQPLVAPTLPTIPLVN